MSETDTIIKVLRKYGTEVKPYFSKLSPGLHVFICPGCGKTIRSDDREGLADVEYSINKRGSVTMFHTKCYRKAWDSKIQ